MFHVKRNERAVVQEASAALELALSPSQIDRLIRYGELLRTRAIPLGLVSERDHGRILSRHVLDSLRAATVIRPDDRRAYDLGSGAGLPGIPVAIAELGLSNARVMWGRVEELSDPVDVCFARAFAPLEPSWRAVVRLLRAGGRLVYFAGASETRLPPLPGASSAKLRPVPLLDSTGSLVIITR